jgi:hypothetical protein
MSLSLYNIEDSLQQLVDLREQAEAEGDSEALKVLNQQLAEYLTAECSKVTSYVALIRSREATVAQCRAEVERIHEIMLHAHADTERLKANALAVMQRFGVKELKATPGGGLRRQANGGKEALEVSPAEIPTGLQRAIVTMPLDLWADICRGMERGLLAECVKPGTLQEKREPDTERIQEALAQRVQCSECSGKGRGEGAQLTTPCPRCNGSGTTPATVPGARLLPRSEHVRVI